MDTLPPVENGPVGAVDGELVIPADNVNQPPEPLLPLPTVIITLPARPEDAVPVPKYKVPLGPVLAVPVLKINTPEMPAVPAFAVWIKKVPELETEL